MILKLVSFMPQSLYLWAKKPQFPFNGRYVCAKADTEAVEKRNVFPCWVSNPGRSAHRDSLECTPTDAKFPAQ
jgi:hypothetical protein